MTTATKTAKPRTTQQGLDGAHHNGAYHNGVAPVDAARAPITETDAALITDTVAAFARFGETAAAGFVRTSNVAGDSVTSLMWELAMIVRSFVRLSLEMFGGVAAEFGEAIVMNLDDDQQAELCFGNPVAWV